MAKRSLTFFDANTEPLTARIAVGLHKVGLAMKQNAWHEAHRGGLSPTQGQILAVLATSGPATASELRERLSLTLPTISDSVRVLAEKELLTKAPDPRHPRASLLSLTPRGRALGEQARAWPEFLASAVEVLSEPEQAAFFTGIVKMIRALQEQGMIPTSEMCVSCEHFRPHAHEGPKPHHCAFVDAPMADEQLRIECPDHRALDEGASAAVFQLFLSPKLTSKASP